MDEYSHDPIGTVEPALPRATLFGLDVELLAQRGSTLWAARRFILACTALGLVLSVAAALLIPVQYEATAVLMPPDAVSTSSLSSVGTLTTKASPALGPLGGLLGQPSPGQLVVAALQTEAMEDRMIRRFDLRKVYGASTLKATRKTLDGRTSVTLDLKSGLISVVVRDHQARRAAEMANAYADELQKLLFEVRVVSATQERQLLAQPVATAKQELDDAAAELSRFSAKNTTLDPEVQGKAMVDAVSAVQGQLIAAEAELKGLQQLYTNDNQRVQQAQAQVMEWRRQLAKLGGEDPTARPQTSSPELYPPIRKLPLLGAQYLELYRRMKIREATYEAFVTELEVNKLLELDGGPKIQILSPATPPEKKSFPPRTLLVLLGTMVCFGMASAWVLGTAAVDRMDALDLRKQLAMRVLARVRRSRSGVAAAPIEADDRETVSTR